jgi:soluble lytic murein transglycosylase
MRGSLALADGDTTPVVHHHHKFANESHRIRVEHSKELLGSSYKKSVVHQFENVEHINDHIYKWTKEQLPKKYKKDYRRVAAAIIDQSKKYEFDPVFLMAVIQGESSFNPTMKGRFGEIGLMQIKPDTAQWIGQKAHIAWKGDDSLNDPVANIRYGAAYLSWLREKFDAHAQLYIAAYNMGQTNVRHAVGKDVWPKDYPMHVMTRYVDFYSQLRANRDVASTAKKSAANLNHAPKVASI